VTTAGQGVLTASRAAAPGTPEVTQRGGCAFAPAGRHAATLAVDSVGRYWVEQWELLPTGARLLRRHLLRGEVSHSTLQPLDDGRVLVSRHSGAGQHLALLGDGEGTELPPRRGRGLNLLPVPAGTGLLTAAVRHDEDGAGTLFGLRSPQSDWQQLGRLPGVVQGAHRCGPALVGTLVTPAGPQAVLLDLAAAMERGEPLTVPLTDAPARVLAAGGGRVLLAVTEPGGPRLGLTAAVPGQPLRLLDRESALHRVGVPLHPVALDPTGTQVLHLETRGARSGLLRHHWERDELEQITVPLGELGTACAWTEAGAWLSCATPHGPAEPALLPTGGTALRLPTDGLSGPTAPAEPEVRTETFPGAAGPVEAVVYGPDWRTAERLLIALHGGPNSHWTLRQEPFLRSAAAAGFTVVAPNQRGSTGYGAAHTLALVDAWGVPDRADIAALADHLRRHRADHLAAPALYGASYGGYLALLTAMTDPGPWSACVAYAPFLSGPRLHADAAEPVRDMVERLGGRGPATDTIGPRDLVRLAAGLRTRTLVLHGALDESVPVAHSRLLADRLAGDAGRRADFRYEELAARGHAAPGAAATDPATVRVLAFLTERQSSTAA
jgi:pimeloyl-ACP methyl ester carboxylesterase